MLTCASRRMCFVLFVGGLLTLGCSGGGSSSSGAVAIDTAFTSSGDGTITLTSAAAIVVAEVLPVDAFDGTVDLGSIVLDVPSTGSPVNMSDVIGGQTNFESIRIAGQVILDQANTTLSVSRDFVLTDTGQIVAGVPGARLTIESTAANGSARLDGQVNLSPPDPTAIGVAGSLFMNGWTNIRVNGTIESRAGSGTNPTDVGGNVNLQGQSLAFGSGNALDVSGDGGLGGTISINSVVVNAGGTSKLYVVGSVIVRGAGTQRIELNGDDVTLGAVTLELQAGDIALLANRMEFFSGATIRVLSGSIFTTATDVAGATNALFDSALGLELR